MEYRWIQGKEEGFEDAAAVRYDVFITEQGYSAELELDEQDNTCLHLVGYENNVPLATCRLFPDAKGEYHIGRVAVLKQQRGRGLGLAMMRKAVEKAQSFHTPAIVLGAQYDKAEFYGRLGFAKTGEEYLDEGYPHVMMRLSLPVEQG